MNKTTICNYATAMSNAGVGIVRISGTQSLKIAKKVLGFSPKLRYAHFTPFIDANKNTIDEGIAIFYQAPNSFTGEDILELQCHGGSVVMEKLLSQVLDYGATLAEAGEFSKRAFLNGKIDLVQAEAIADLIDASSQQAAKSAIKSLQGDFSKRINTLVQDLINLRVFVESTIDFSDEELDFIASDEISNRIKKITSAIEEILNQATQGRLLQQGINVIIAGKPNAGKSSLFNALTQEDTAIVTDIAGTTRDIIKEKIILNGVPIHLFDTAGLRHSEDTVEKVGINRAKLAIKDADIVLLVYDAREKPDLSLVAENNNILLVKNKIDLISNPVVLDNEVYISAKNKTGIDVLKQKLKELTQIQNLDNTVILARKRHIIALEKALKHINIALNQEAIELLAQDLRITQEQLGQITGKFGSDDLLGEIFSSFCIGK